MWDGWHAGFLKRLDPGITTRFRYQKCGNPEPYKAIFFGGVSLAYSLYR